MKNYIGRKIIRLMTIAIISTSILIAVLGIYLSEGIISDIRGQENIPDLSVLAEVTSSYMEGNISNITFGEIMRNSGDSETRKYYIYDEQELLIFATAKIDAIVKAEMLSSLKTVLGGESVSHRLYPLSQEPVELVGVPVVQEGVTIGAAYVIVDMVDLKVIRNWFLSSLFIAIIIVIIFVVIISNIALKSIVKPIRNVVEVALSMVEGDFTIRADETLAGEIGLFSKTLNKLSINLYKNVSQLTIEKNRLSHVLESLEEGMIAVDQYQEITHFNNVCLDMFNIEKEDLSHHNLQDIEVFHPVCEAINRVLDFGDSMSIKHERGDKVLRILMEPIEDEKGAIVGSVVLFRNITEMEHLENTRKNYVANVSHELRSPLTSIQGLIEPLIDGIVQEEMDKQRYYNIIYQESLRLSRLVNDMMELSRLQTSDIVIMKSDVDVDEVIELVVERFQLPNSKVNLVYEATDLPRVRSNYDRIEQVLVILLDNAIKFTGDDGIITIETYVRDQVVYVSVIDTGIGIEKENVAFIFDRFYKTNHSRNYKGTGLGLSIVKEIMTLMGESIVCESEIGQGSTFTFTIHGE